MERKKYLDHITRVAAKVDSIREEEAKHERELLELLPVNEVQHGSSTHARADAITFALAITLSTYTHTRNPHARSRTNTLTAGRAPPTHTAIRHEP